MDLNQLYSDIILEHNQNPANKRELTPFTLQEHGHNPSCGDDITLRADIHDGIVQDAAYTGHGCAISQASADMMIDLIKGKTVPEALRLVDLFLDMVDHEGNKVDGDQILYIIAREGLRQGQLRGGAVGTLMSNMVPVTARPSGVVLK